VLRLRARVRYYVNDAVTSVTAVIGIRRGSNDQFNRAFMPCIGLKREKGAERTSHSPKVCALILAL
jgi:hypothetical protein